MQAQLEKIARSAAIPYADVTTRRPEGDRRAVLVLSKLLCHSHENDVSCERVLPGVHISKDSAVLALDVWAGSIKKKEWVGKGVNYVQLVNGTVVKIVFNICNWCQHDCDQQGKIKFKCGDCRVTRYCSTDCQEDDRAKHKLVCAGLKRVAAIEKQVWEPRVKVLAENPYATIRTLKCETPDCGCAMMGPFYVWKACKCEKEPDTCSMRNKRFVVYK